MNSTTVVWRHRRENLKKCSLRGLESRPDFHFYTYPFQMPPHLRDFVALSLDALPLVRSECFSGLFLIDATWRLADKMAKQWDHPPSLTFRSLPSGFVTAYPRRQDDCSDPERGLASIEALYVAHHILGWNKEGLFANYYWGEAFLEKNQQLLGEG